MKFCISTAFVTLLTLPALAENSSYYRGPGLFSQRPSETASIQNIKRFGPIGLSIDLVQPAFVMKVAAVEPGSPAGDTGKFEKGQTIESINGEKLKDIDPRIQMGNWITRAEAFDGKLTFKIKELAQPVVVQIPVLGAYSDTWPMNCKKSDQIVRNLADYISADPKRYGLGDLGMFFLISTGDPEDTKVVGEWARKHKPHTYAWYAGFGGIPLCEYYLRTGDQEVLPVIQEQVKKALGGMYNDAWAGRGSVPGLNYGDGHLNAAGTAVVTFLLLAKECGVDVPDEPLSRVLTHFYRYAGKGINPYGDHRPEVGFVDNGKNGNLAFAMAAAAALTPDGENSVYAKARDVCAMPSFYTTSFMLHGHTGGGIGEMWRSSSMGLMKDKKPKQYREFMDHRRWHYELSRRYDGSFGILGGGGYDGEKWGVAYGLCYTVPRKTLRITGAPPTKWSKPYKLPKLPWGTEADNEFLSMLPVAMPDGSVMDLSGETLAEDASIPVLRKLAPPDISDDLIRKYVRHPDAAIRRVAAAKALGYNSGYIGWLEESGKLRPELVSELMRSKSARIRRPIFAAIEHIVRKEGKAELLTPEVYELCFKAIADPEESWWVQDACLHLISYADADTVVPHTNLLLSYLNHEGGWWLQNAAMKALTPVVADARTYKKVIPAIGKLLQGNQRAALAKGMLPQMRSKIRESSVEIQAFAVSTLKETYTGFNGMNRAEGGLDISSTVTGHMTLLAESLAEMPGGLDVLYAISREKFPDVILPYKELFLNADPSDFGPELKKAITPIIMNELVPEYVGKNRRRLQDAASLEKQSSRPGGKQDSIDELVALYTRAGHEEYQWKMFLNLRNADWQYHSFDPIPEERQPWDHLVTRYREVTLPMGMEEWFQPGFEWRKAGWKTGKSPFGHFNGKIPKGVLSKCHDGCVGPICYGTLGANTLWEKEVFMMRKQVKVPKLKEGHRYRIIVNHRTRVGNGGGFAIYVNGRKLSEMKNCIGRGGGEQQYGGFITADFLNEFDGEEVTLAAISFLRYNDKYKAKPTEKMPNGLISIHIQEQKLPPMGEDLVIRSAEVVPFTNMAWQEAVFATAESDEIDPDSAKFRWDGKVVANGNLKGKWKALAHLRPGEEFDPAKKYNPSRAIFKQLDFKPEGRTTNPLLLWSGDVLMDLDSYQALQISPMTIGGIHYLVLENGNFSNRHKPGWKPDTVVFTKTE